MNPVIPVVATLAGLGATKAPRRKRKNNNGDEPAEEKTKTSAQRKKRVLEAQLGLRKPKRKAEAKKASSSPAPEKAAGASRPFAAAFSGRRKAKEEGEKGPGTTLLGKILNARHGPSPASSRGSAGTPAARAAAAASRGARRPSAPDGAATAAKLTGPGSLFHRRIGGDIILSEDGQQGFVGARWWAETGRPLLEAVTPPAGFESPDEAAVALLGAARQDIDWGAPQAPEGVVAVRRRVSHYVQAAALSENGPEGAAVPAAGMAPPPSPHQFGGPTEGAPAGDDTEVEAEPVEASPQKRKRRGARGRKKDTISDESHDHEVGGDAVEVSADAVDAGAGE